MSSFQERSFVLLVEDVLAFIVSLVFTMKVLLSLVWHFSESSSGWMFLPGSTCLGAGALLGSVPLWPPSLETSAYSLLSQALTAWLLSAVSWLPLAPTPSRAPLQ